MALNKKGLKHTRDAMDTHRLMEGYKQLLAVQPHVGLLMTEAQALTKAARSPTDSTASQQGAGSTASQQGEGVSEQQEASAEQQGVGNEQQALRSDGEQQGTSDAEMAAGDEQRVQQQSDNGEQSIRSASERHIEGTAGDGHQQGRQEARSIDSMNEPEQCLQPELKEESASSQGSSQGRSDQARVVKKRGRSSGQRYKGHDSNAVVLPPICAALPAEKQEQLKGLKRQERQLQREYAQLLAQYEERVLAVLSARDNLASS